MHFTVFFFYMVHSFTNALSNVSLKDMLPNGTTLLEVNTQEEDSVLPWDHGSFAFYLTTKFCLGAWVCPKTLCVFNTVQKK